MPDYIPPTLDWVREQVELYESSGGTQGNTLLDTGMPCILVTHTGNKTGGIRKIPLMRVEVDGNYVLIGSMGGQPKNPVWVYNLRAHPDIQIRDKTEVFNMRARKHENTLSASLFNLNIPTDVFHNLIDTFKKLFDDAWGSRLEGVLRATLYALIEYALAQ